MITPGADPKPEPEPTPATNDSESNTDSTSDAGQYFSGTPTVGSSERTVTLMLPDLTCDLVTDRGVFSGSGIDPGTRYLLSDAPAPAATVRTALDLGCGYGPIARTIAHRSPDATVWAIDVNTRALALAQRNTADHNVMVSLPADVPDDVTFDLIWSNPPIRVGKAALHEMLLTWLPRLNPGGLAVLVVQKHLGADSLARWLIDQGHQTERLASRRGYRLLAVQPANQTGTPS